MRTSNENVEVDNRKFRWHVHGFVLDWSHWTLYPFLDIEIEISHRPTIFRISQLLCFAEAMSMPTLPQDLIDHIIDLVARTVGDNQGSSRDLIACSLVSKSFRYRCTKHLFSTIHLS